LLRGCSDAPVRAGSIRYPQRAADTRGRTKWQLQARDVRQEASSGRDAFMAGRDFTIINTYAPQGPVPDDPSHKVFVVHGRNEAARSAMFAFLRSIGLRPIEWSEAVQMTGEGSPYIGQVLDTALDAARAIVVLLTSDDIAYLRSEYASGDDDRETEPQAQARPNVLFEAGMAMGRDPSALCWSSWDGSVRSVTLSAAMLSVSIIPPPSARNWLSDWRVPVAGSTSQAMTGLMPETSRHRRPQAAGCRWASGCQALDITNYGSGPVHDLDIELPTSLLGFRLVDPGFQIARLPAGKSVTMMCSLSMPRNFSHFDVELPLDDDGFMRRECPHCLREFKWHHGPTEARPEGMADPPVYHCPRCGDPARPDEWWTQEQLAFTEQLVTGHALREATEMLENSVRDSKSVTFKPPRDDAPEPPEALHEPNDMIIVGPPCHPWEPIKVPEDATTRAFCLICGEAFAA
jgi:hypothetical protein